MYQISPSLCEYSLRNKSSIWGNRSPPPRRDVQTGRHTSAWVRSRAIGAQWNQHRHGDEKRALAQKLPKLESRGLVTFHGSERSSARIHIPARSFLRVHLVGHRETVSLTKMYALTKIFNNNRHCPGGEASFAFTKITILFGARAIQQWQSGKTSVANTRCLFDRSLPTTCFSRVPRQKESRGCCILFRMCPAQLDIYCNHMRRYSR